MSFTYGHRSQLVRATLHPFVRAIFDEAIQVVDLSLLCGHRGEQAQAEAFAAGRSQKEWPDSVHNRFPSLACDWAPHPIDWGDKGTAARRAKDLARFYYVAGLLDALTHAANVRRIDAGLGSVFEYRSGADWDGDLDFNDQKFDDLGHSEWRERVLTV